MRLICDGDNHYPYHDPVAENAKLKFAAWIKPTHWVNIGDNYDFFSISSFSKDPGQYSTLQAEFQSAQPYWKEVARVTSKDIHFIKGNHCKRMERLIADNPGLHGLKALNLKTAAELPGRVKVHEHGSIINVGRIGFMHGDQVKGSGNPAQWVLSNMPGMSYVFGHFHRSQTVYRTARDPDGGSRSFVAAAQGHGCDVKMAKYDPLCPWPQWQAGFTYIEGFTVAGKQRFSLHPIVIVDGRFSWGGRVFDGRVA